jgi:hypothetical protein
MMIFEASAATVVTTSVVSAGTGEHVTYATTPPGRTALRAARAGQGFPDQGGAVRVDFRGYEGGAPLRDGGGLRSRRLRGSGELGGRELGQAVQEA